MPSRKATVARTKVPAVRFIADDLVVRAGGQEYRPHAGEFAEVEPVATIDDFSLMIRLQRLRNLKELTAEEMDELAPVLEDVAHLIVRSVRSWDWTDNRGTSYPSPPDLAVIRSLSFEEMTWLLQAVMGTLTTEKARKNGSTPST